jgi:hypothetical protein
VGRGEALMFFHSSQPIVPIFHYSTIPVFSITPTFHQSIGPLFQSSSWDVPAGESPDFPYNQVTKMLPAKVRKLPGIPKRGGPAGGRGERISFSFVGLMDQWHIAEIFRDKHNK